AASRRAGRRSRTPQRAGSFAVQRRRPVNCWLPSLSSPRIASYSRRRRTGTRKPAPLNDMSTDLPPTDLGAAREVQARIHAHLPGLQAAEVRVARVVLEQPNVVIYKSASEVAELASTSSATVIRCAQKMGFKGFHDLKLALANELAVFEQARVQERREPDDPRTAVLMQITRAGAESVRDAGALVDPDAFEAVVAAIADARRVVFFGVGTSAP